MEKNCRVLVIEDISEEKLSAEALHKAKEIRKDPQWSTLPIVAMTANVMQEDRIAYLEVGMNDFIAKPIEPDLLWTVILKWIKPRKK